MENHYKGDGPLKEMASRLSTMENENASLRSDLQSKCNNLKVTNDQRKHYQEVSEELTKQNRKLRNDVEQLNEISGRKSADLNQIQKEKSVIEAECANLRQANDLLEIEKTNDARLRRKKEDAELKNMQIRLNEATKAKSKMDQLWLAGTVSPFQYL